MEVAPLAHPLTDRVVALLAVSEDLAAQVAAMAAATLLLAEAAAFLHTGEDHSHHDTNLSNHVDLLEAKDMAPELLLNV